LALFLIANDLTPHDIETGERELAFPQSAIDLLDGSMGQPRGGFPAKVRKRILRDRKPLRGRPGKTLPPADFEKTATEIETLLGRRPSRRETVSYLLYPQVFREFAAHQQRYSDTSGLPTPVFLYGMQPSEEVAVDIEPGKTLIIRLLVVGEPHFDGRRTVFFELNGQPRDVSVVDHSMEQPVLTHVKADPSDPSQVAAPMPGMVVAVAVNEGAKVARGQKLLTLEAMKMQTTIVAEYDGRVTRLLIAAGSQVETGDLLVVVDPVSE
jgi:pyruvate carboxylase